MASRRSTTRRLSTVPIKKPADEDFVAAEMFDFSKSFKSPKGVITRARRSSMVLTKPPLPAKNNRRKSMMPVVEEKVAPARASASSRAPAPAPATNKRRSLAPPKTAVVTKGIELKNFYQSPKTSSAGGRAVSKPKSSTSKAAAARNLQLAPSPTKKIGPNDAKYLTDDQIIKSLDEAIEESPEKPAAAPQAKTPKPAKTTRAAKTPKASKKTPAKTPPASAKRATRQTPAVKSQKKVNKKVSPKSTKKAVKADKENSVLLADVQEIKIKLKSLGSFEDPNVIISTVESIPATPERVDQVVEKLIKDQTSRKRKATDDETEVTPSKKPRMQSSAKTPVSAPAPKTPVAKSTRKTPAPKSTKKTPAPKSVKKTPAPKSVKKTPAPKSVKKTPVAPKSIKKTEAPNSAKKTPAPKSSMKKSASVKSSAKSVKLPEVGGSSGGAGPVMKKTPGIRRTLARTSALVSTPVQVNPAKLLKRNLRTKVETAIVNKMAQKPDSSPYLLANSDENSPKFEKLSSSKENTEVIKPHITGTPVNSRRNRKFGTVVQPSMLAAESPVPMTTRRMSSTPMRGKRLDTAVMMDGVESTPIRAPPQQIDNDETMDSAPMSPPGQMVTGKLEKLCVIM